MRSSQARSRCAIPTSARVRTRRFRELSPLQLNASIPLHRARVFRSCARSPIPPVENLKSTRSLRPSRANRPAARNLGRPLRHRFHRCHNQFRQFEGECAGLGPALGRGANCQLRSDRNKSGCIPGQCHARRCFGCGRRVDQTVGAGRSHRCAGFHRADVGENGSRASHGIAAWDRTRGLDGISLAAIASSQLIASLAASRARGWRSTLAAYFKNPLRTVTVELSSSFRGSSSARSERSSGDSAACTSGRSNCF